MGRDDRNQHATGRSGHHAFGPCRQHAVAEGEKTDQPGGIGYGQHAQNGQQGGVANHVAPLGRKTPTPSRQTYRPAHTSRCAAIKGKHRRR